MKPSGINWEEVRHRLRVSGATLEGVLADSPERVASVWSQRAARLATRSAEDVRGVPVLIFRLAQERYAIELQELAEVLRDTRCTPFPGAPGGVLGLIQRRGEIRVVWDLSRTLALSPSLATDPGFVLVLRGPGREIGLKVEQVEGLGEARLEGTEAPAGASPVKGIAADGLMILSVDAVLSKVFAKQES